MPCSHEQVAIGSRPQKWRVGRLRNLVEEIAAAPLTALRFYRSYRAGRRMYDDGPLIPPLDADESRRSSAC